MGSYRFWQKQKEKGSSKSASNETDSIDLFSQLTYMSAIATAGLSRKQLFHYSAQLPYASSRYFRKVHLLSEQLNYDYAEACRIVGESVKDEAVGAFLLRLSGSLSSGEFGPDYLVREAEAQGETCGNEYERSLESLRKWTDAYTALIVSAALVVVVAIVSMMIYHVSPVFILGLSLVMIITTISGAWLIYRTAPAEMKVHALSECSTGQRLSQALFKVCVPAATASVLIFPLLGMSLGWTLMGIAAWLLPVGLVSLWDNRKIDQKDGDIAALLRTVGGVATAIGTTITEALGRVDLRSAGSLAPGVQDLHVRLGSKIKPELCWQRFVAETGSEQVNRSVRIFWDGVSLGGDPEQVGHRSSLYAMKIAFLRAKRRLVASSFKWLCIVMHASIVALLVFIVQMVDIFGKALENMQPMEDTAGVLSRLPEDGVFSFNSAELQLLHWIVVLVLLVLTAANAFAARSAEGGHFHTFFFYFGLMLAISGGGMVFIPEAADMVFSSVPAM